MHSPIMDSEAQEILQNLEDDFRHDLSLHLYSAFLLHLENTSFPPKRWTAWPLPYDKVPDPKTAALYVDEKNPFAQRLPSTRKVPKRDSEDGKPPLPHWEYQVLEELTDPNENLEIELHAVFERLLRSQTLIELPVEPPISLTSEAVSRTVAKIDHLIDKLVMSRINKKMSAQTPETTVNKDRGRLITWQHVVSTSANEKAWQRCSKLFPDSTAHDEKSQEKNNFNTVARKIHKKKLEISARKRKLNPNINESDYTYRFEGISS